MSYVTADVAAEVTPGAMRRLVAMSLAGSSIEWYDFFLYGVGAALVFPALFFPSTLPHSVALVASFGTFAVGFVARPIGAVLFGHVGDRIGRKSALAMALVLMGLATTLIACLPSYAVLGVGAPLALVLLRFAQGLAIGGQWGGAMLMIVESAPRERRGFYGSFAQAGVPVGVVTANLAFLALGALTSPDDFIAWGWRVPFLLSMVLVLLGVYVHLKVEETPAYRGLRHAPRIGREAVARSPIIAACRSHPRAIAQAAGAFLAINLCFYISITYVISYGTDPDGLAIPRRVMLAGVLVASAVASPLLIAAGALSDRFGRRRVYMTGAVLTAISSFTLFPLIDSRSLPWIALGVAATMGCNNLMYGPQAALFGELFPTSVRYSGASLGYQTGAILGGGFAPLVATALVAHFHSTIGVSIYMALACLVAFVSVASLNETSGVSLQEQGTE
jgi:MFS family permease